MGIKRGSISVEAGASPKEVGLLKRCMVGHFNKESQETPVLANIRRWTSTNWKSVFGVKIFEMLGDSFLFEFSNNIWWRRFCKKNLVLKNSRLKSGMEENPFLVVLQIHPSSQPPGSGPLVSLFTFGLKTFFMKSASFVEVG